MEESLAVESAGLVVMLPTAAAMVGTSVLAFSSLNWLYISVGSMGLLALARYAFFLSGAGNISG